jgi:hypothetical protein
MLRRIDARFLLPHPVRRAAVLQGADEWRPELERAGIAVDSGGDLDLAVAPAERAAEALALRPRAIVLEGRRARVSATDFEARRCLPLPSLAEPIVFVPLGGGGPARYAVKQWAFADRRWKRVRNRALGDVAARGLLPSMRPEVLVAAPRGLPFVVRAGLEHGLSEDVRPLLLAGQGDDYSRATFLLFEPRAREPSWALKFARLPVRLGSFERERMGLELVREAGGVVAERAPRWLASFEAEGLQCTLETAARGKPLLALLRSSPSRPERLQAIGRVCAWLIKAALSTQAGPGALQEERRRLTDAVLPHWEVDRRLAEELPEVPAVLVHSDLGSWNVVSAGNDFTVLDWEDAIRHGLPLWDLLYFLADATAHLDGSGAAPEAQAEHFERLFLGRAQSSDLLFRWVRAYVDALGLSPEAVGPLATLCWLQGGVAGEQRAEEARDPGAGRYAAFALMRERAERWLRVPGLGASWNAWR